MRKLRMTNHLKGDFPRPSPQIALCGIVLFSAKENVRLPRKRGVKYVKLQQTNCPTEALCQTTIPNRVRQIRRAANFF